MDRKSFKVRIPETTRCLFSNTVALPSFDLQIIELSVPASQNGTPFVLEIFYCDTFSVSSVIYEPCFFSVTVCIFFNQAASLNIARKNIGKAQYAINIVLATILNGLPFIDYTSRLSQLLINNVNKKFNNIIY